MRPPSDERETISTKVSIDFLIFSNAYSSYFFIYIAASFRDNPK